MMINTLISHVGVPHLVTSCKALNMCVYDCYAVCWMYVFTCLWFVWCLFAFVGSMIHSWTYHRDCCYQVWISYNHMQALLGTFLHDWCFSMLLNMDSYRCLAYRTSPISFRVVYVLCVALLCISCVQCLTLAFLDVHRCWFMCFL